jgi:hypothetical protein
LGNLEENTKLLSEPRQALRFYDHMQGFHFTMKKGDDYNLSLMFDNNMKKKIKGE